jgi:hypothetical protein
MKLLTLAALVSISAIGSATIYMQDKKPRFAYPVSKDADGGFARFMETCKPSAAHARLSELLGSYDMTMRMGAMDAGNPQAGSKGTSEVTWLVEGKWLLAKNQVNMFGRDVATTAILGYDNFKERYVWCSVNSMQTTLNTAAGLFDQAGNDLTLWGVIDEPMTPEQDKQVKYVYRGFGTDKCTFEVHDMMIGEPNTKVVEFELTRKK